MEGRADREGSRPSAREPGARGRACGPALLGVLVLAGCVPELVSDALEPRDLTPAGVVAWDSSGSRELLVEFDEEIHPAPGGFAAAPDLGVLETLAEGSRLRIRTGADAAPGRAFSLEGLVEDASGNTTSFVLPFWGYNPALPRVVINEALTQGSSAHPDALELRSLEAGNLAGLAFFVGTPGHPVLRYVFPDCEVAAGAFIVLHMSPQGIPQEIDETEDPTASGGLDAAPEARDFWYRDGGGALPGENGVLTLCRSPTGGLVDALLYSARTSESDSKYLGFGSQALLAQARDLASAGAWGFSGEDVRPEDAARSSGTTSTRTLCRSRDSGDSDSGSDWHVVPTRGSTIGSENTDERYEP